MTDRSRRAIFISHANPEDNAFTLWLGSRLSAMGYDVWADILRLRGGHDWQRLLENALREKACKVLFVGTESGASKQGVRNEIQIAHDVSRRINDPEFIIPLRLSDFDAPFLIVHSQYIDFRGGWAGGLVELVETLEDTYAVPRKDIGPSYTLHYWRDVHVRYARELSTLPEPLVSNWLRFVSLPKSVIFYDFAAGINLDSAQDKIRSAPWPTVPFKRGFLACCEKQDLEEHFGEELPFTAVSRTAISRFLKVGWSSKGITRLDAHKRFGDLTRQAAEFALAARALTPYEMADGHRAWWLSRQVVPEGQIPFEWRGGLRGRRQLIGYSAKRNRYWHYGVSLKPRVFPFLHVRLVARVIFSEDGVTPIGDSKRMHRLRRSFTRSWRNAKWRDLMLAFLSWLSQGQQKVVLAFGTTAQAELGLPPVSLVAPFSVEADEPEERAGEDYFDMDDADGAEVDLDDEWEEAATSEDAEWEESWASEEEDEP